MKDKFWNFVFYKFIFVFGVVNVQYLNEVRPCLQIKIHRVHVIILCGEQETTD